MLKGNLRAKFKNIHFVIVFKIILILKDFKTNFA